MPILPRFAIFLDFYNFREVVTTAFSGISKFPTVKFEIHSFSCHLFETFCFPVTQICAMGAGLMWGKD